MRLFSWFTQSQWGQTILALGLLAAGYLIIISNFSKTQTPGWQRHLSFYSSYITLKRDGGMREDAPLLSAVTKKPSDTIYFRTAALITQPKGGISLRITSLQECSNKRTTRVRIGELVIPLKKTTVHKKCPWSFVPQCRLVGYYATGTTTESAEEEVPLPTPLPKFAEIYDGRLDTWIPIELVDGRSSPAPRPHRLAVCLQPVYLMADWMLIPHFFETWIGNGATLFYIYVHSISEEVDLMLKMYEKQKDIEVVRVDWPAVPASEEDDDDRNPNNRMYRTEVATAINDCLLRARATAEYAASSDLDEIITPLNLKGNNEKLLDVIDDHRARKMSNGAEPGAFLFRQSFGYAENDWFSISHPSQLTFDHYKTVQYGNKVWQRGQRSKVIYIPDRVLRAHVHDFVGYESNKFGTMVIDPKRARVLHFRQVKNNSMKRENFTTTSQLLRDSSQGWQKTYTARVEEAIESEGSSKLVGAFNLTFSTPNWPNLGEEVLTELDECRGKNLERAKEKCATEWSCRAKMTVIRPGQWVEPDSEKTWIVI